MTQKQQYFLSGNYNLLFYYSKPKFLDSHVLRIEEGWDDTKDKATQRLDLLNDRKAAWEGYELGLDNID